MSENPFGDFREECKKLLTDALNRLYPEAAQETLIFELPPSPDFGELSSSLCLSLTKKLGKPSRAMADEIAESVDTDRADLVKSVSSAGPGYVNFHADYSRLAGLTLRSAEELDSKFGFLKAPDPVSVIVEHTSANPIHPLHIGTARNPVLGDSIVRLLKARGHSVKAHFYIDDMGRQVAIAAYGYEKLGQPDVPKGVKPDHFIGDIYSVTSSLVEIRGLKERVRQLEDAYPTEQAELQRVRRELDDWVGSAAELEMRCPEMFDELASRIAEDPDPEEGIAMMTRLYETGDEEVSKLFRRVSGICLEGFRQTLDQIGIRFDSWDWESDLVRSGRVSEVVRKLEAAPDVVKREGILQLDIDSPANRLGLKKILGLSEDHSIPPLTLIRSDGTTLYTTRDIAYSLQKFEQADRVINVIGAEQSLAQIQLRVALGLIASSALARNLVHFAFGLVKLPGYRMSGRKGRYISLDQVIGEAVRLAYEEVSKRSPDLDEETRRSISMVVGVGAVKYALVSVEPIKTVSFTWDRVLDFERNSAPFIQYAHARCSNILKKAGEMPSEAHPSLLSDPLERALLLKVARYPETVADAADSLRPNAVAEHANATADQLNTFYAALPVIRADTEDLRAARLHLVNSVRIVLRNALGLLGIDAPERM